MVNVKDLKNCCCLPTSWYLLLLALPSTHTSKNQFESSSSSSLRIFVGDSVVETNMLNPSGGYNTPYYDNEMISNLTLEAGQIAELPCIVRQLGSKLVSWIRKSDSAILTVEKSVFIFDPRISIQSQPYSSTWTLSIDGVRGQDSGLYECQVSSEPKLSKFILLNIKVPLLQIEGAPKKLAKRGSEVVLQCAVKNSKIQRTLQWSLQKEGKGLELLNSKTINQSLKNNTGIYRVQSMDENDVGLYTCMSENLNPVSVQLLLLPEETQAEGLQDGLNGSALPDTHLLRLSALIYILALKYF